MNKTRANDALEEASLRGDRFEAQLKERDKQRDEAILRLRELLNATEKRDIWVAAAITAKSNSFNFLNEVNHD